MIEIPQDLLTAYGGSFTRDQVVDIVERHMEMGGYAVINTYGINPVVTELGVTSSQVTVSWPSYGSDVSYNVYYSNAIDTGFVKANTGLIVDSLSGNQFDITGLTASTKYFIKVGAVDSSGNESFGAVVSATTETSVT